MSQPTVSKHWRSTVILTNHCNQNSMCHH